MEWGASELPPLQAALFQLPLPEPDVKVVPSSGSPVSDHGRAIVPSVVYGPMTLFAHNECLATHLDHDFLPQGQIASPVQLCQALDVMVLDRSVLAPAELTRFGVQAQGQVSTTWPQADDSVLQWNEPLPPQGQSAEAGHAVGLPFPLDTHHEGRDWAIL